MVFAIGQHDLKRLLAYHSIENIGIILMGLGLAMLGRSLGRADWIVLGLGGACCTSGTTAFQVAAVPQRRLGDPRDRTREIDRLGGLAKAMPLDRVCFPGGAVAICGLPPLNGFVSEFLIYLGLFGTLGRNKEPLLAGAALAAPALAMIGALAVACFVKVYGAVFLGNARSEHAGAHESPEHDRADGRAGSLCFLIGLAPVLLSPLLGQGIAAWTPNPHTSPLTPAPLPRCGGEGAGVRGADYLAPLGWITIVGLLLVGALALAGRPCGCSTAAASWPAAPPGGCGYAVPTPRMQYTSSSFAQMLVALFGWCAAPAFPQAGESPAISSKSRFSQRHTRYRTGRSRGAGLSPGAWLCSKFRVLQQGSIQTYLLYIFIALIALLLVISY